MPRVHTNMSYTQELKRQAATAAETVERCRQTLQAARASLSQAHTDGSSEDAKHECDLAVEAAEKALEEVIHNARIKYVGKAQSCMLSGSKG